jgi:hypothetical protein
MGLLSQFYTGQLFTQAWVDALKGTPEQGMVATIELYEPNTGEALYDEETGEYVSEPTILYTGKARVQPMRSARQGGVQGNDSYSQVVQFQIPIDQGKLIDIRPKHRVKVTAAPLNPMLTKYLYAVSEVLDSSNPLERTFYATVNLETVVA